MSSHHVYAILWALLAAEVLLISFRGLQPVFRAYLLIPILWHVRILATHDWSWRSAAGAWLLTVAELAIAAEAILMVTYTLYEFERSSIRWASTAIGGLLIGVAAWQHPAPYAGYPAALQYLSSGHRLMALGALTVPLAWLLRPRVWVHPQYILHAALMWCYFLPWVLVANAQRNTWTLEGAVLLSHLATVAAWVCLCVLKARPGWSGASGSRYRRVAPEVRASAGARGLRSPG